MSRLANTKDAAKELGFKKPDGSPNPRAFLHFVAGDPKFPKPVRESLHHKIWDIKAIEQYLDMNNSVKPQSPKRDYDAILSGRLKHGKYQGEISA